MATERLSATERRQAIIESAAQLFSEKGFRGVTTRELAHAVGVSEPVLYQHFQTKREIYSAIVESKSQQMECRFEPLLQTVKNDEKDNYKVLRDIATNITRWYEEDPTLNRLLLFSALEGHEFSDLFFAKHASAQFDVLKQYFEHRIDTSVFRSADPATAAWAFIGMVAHYAMARNLYHFDPYPQPKDRVIDQMVDLFLRGVQGGDSHDQSK